MQLANQRREGHVDDRDVEVDHERCQQQRDENQGTALHGSCNLHEGLPGRRNSQLSEATPTLTLVGCMTQLIRGNLGSGSPLLAGAEGGTFLALSRRLRIGARRRAGVRRGLT